MRHYIVYTVLVSTFLCGVDTGYREFDIDYIITRLSRHISLFAQFNKKSKKLQKQSGFVPRLSLDTSLTYYHNLTWLYSKKMEQEKTIDPLFHMWDLFIKQFKMIEPHLMLVETTTMILSIYKNFFLALDDHRFTITTPERIVSWYNHLEVSPFDETLDVLDDCYQEFSRVMKKYHIFNTYDWSEWLINHWWLGPCIACSILYTLFKRQEIAHYLVTHQKRVIDRIQSAYSY